MNELLCTAYLLCARPFHLHGVTDFPQCLYMAGWFYSHCTDEAFEVREVSFPEGRAGEQQSKAPT